jgi:hypothetical protein
MTEENAKSGRGERLTLGGRSIGKRRRLFQDSFPRSLQAVVTRRKLRGVSYIPVNNTRL